MTTAKGIRTGLRNALAVPRHPCQDPASRGHNDLSEDFWSSTDGWFAGRIDTARLGKRLRSLHLRPGLDLVGFVFRAGDNGNGVVYAVPATKGEDADGAWVRCSPAGDEGSLFEPPRPADALPHVMEAFEGDGSFRSYLEASLLLRELLEYGALWHGTSWGAHELLGADPFDEDRHGLSSWSADMLGRETEWSWDDQRPTDWRPRVMINPDGTAQVEFITFSGLERASLVRHVDRYSTGSCLAECSMQGLAQGPGGYVF